MIPADVQPVPATAMIANVARYLPMKENPTKCALSLLTLKAKS
jgi:hypothetical protein